jgi:hypothetical protein
VPLLAPVLAVVALVGAAMALYDFVGAAEAKAFGTHNIDHLPGEFVSWVMGFPDYSLPAPAADSAMYYQ